MWLDILGQRCVIEKGKYVYWAKIVIRGVIGRDLGANRDTRHPTLPAYYICWEVAGQIIEITRHIRAKYSQRSNK